MAAEQARNLSLDGLRQKRARAVAQNLGQRIGKSSWLRELENISVGHGVSLLCWRSGGLEHPHDTPPYPFTPSPTFVHSSVGDGATPTAAHTKNKTDREAYNGCCRCGHRHSAVCLCVYVDETMRVPACFRGNTPVSTSSANGAQRASLPCRPSRARWKSRREVSGLMCCSTIRSPRRR